ncbi:MAG: signal peptidase I [Oscillospiraceae bacterium]|nr:signal peptidase I [Oscillospiraceae bacterium]MDE6776635.1 signal peptidase I [Oscillospiraceae bacterium]
MKEYVIFSRNPKIHKFIGEFLDIAGWAIIPIQIMVLLFAYVFQIATVKGDSMLPTLQDTDKLLVFQLNHRPNSGDVVIINAENSVLFGQDGFLYESDGLHKSIVKRVIAVGGEMLEINSEEGIVYINGEPQEELYTNTITQLPSTDNAFTYPVIIPEGFVFVMGDNRDISMDSRYAEVGLVAEEAIEGIVLLRLYPLESIGVIK